MALFDLAHLLLVRSITLVAKATQQCAMLRQDLADRALVGAELENVQVQVTHLEDVAKVGALEALVRRHQLVQLLKLSLCEAADQCALVSCQGLRVVLLIFHAVLLQLLLDAEGLIDGVLESSKVLEAVI